jgi:hypothetical protein
MESVLISVAAATLIISLLIAAIIQRRSIRHERRRAALDEGEHIQARLEWVLSGEAATFRPGQRL